MGKGFKQKQTYLGESKHASVRKTFKRGLNKKVVTNAFAIKNPFSSREEIEQYLSCDTIQCLICGREFPCQLGTHLAVHGINRHEYKKMYNIPESYSLVTAAWHRKKSEAMKPEQLNHFKNIIRPGKPKGIKIEIPWLKEEHRVTLRLYDHKKDMSKGENSKNAVMTDDDVKTVRSDYAEANGKHGTIALLARRFNVSEGCIHSIVHNRGWKHLLPTKG